MTREQRTRLVLGCGVMLLGSALSCCASRTALRSAQVSFLASQAADLHSTHQALSAGAVEANIFLPSDWRGQLAVKTAESAALLWLSERLSKEHPKLAAILVSAAAVAYGLIARHNYALVTQ